MATRWGILGAGLISSDFVTAVQGLPSEEHQMVAVAARHLESAQAFASRFHIPNAYGSYQDVAHDPNVEVAYIGTVNSNHYELAKMMLENGKHVLCEKPMCLNAKQTIALVQLARSKELFLMEAIWSRFFPVYQRLRQEITSGQLGQVVQVNVTFAIKIAEVERVIKRELGGGVVLDIGIYALQLTSLAFGGQRPKVIKAVGHINEHGVDVSDTIALLYPCGGMASINISARQVLENCAYIAGTKGVIKVQEPFWCPLAMVLPNGETQEYPLPGLTQGSYNFRNSEGLLYQAKEVRRYLKEGLKESPFIPLAESILLAEIRDEIRKQVGVTYDCD